MKDTLKFLTAFSIIIGVAYVLYFLNDPYAIPRWLQRTLGFLVREDNLLLISGILLASSICILLPLAVFPKNRAFSGSVLRFAANIFGALLWLMSLIITASWSLTAFIIGIFTLTLGFVPIAMIKSGLDGRWMVLGELVLLFLLYSGIRLIALRIRRESLPRPPDVPSPEHTTGSGDHLPGQSPAPEGSRSVGQQDGSPRGT